MIDWVTERAYALMHLPIAYLLIRIGFRDWEWNKFFSIFWFCCGIALVPLSIMAMQNTKFWCGDDFHSSQSGSVEYMESLIVSETNVVEGEISGSENLEDY